MLVLYKKKREHKLRYRGKNTQVEQSGHVLYTCAFPVARGAYETRGLSSYLNRVVHESLLHRCLECVLPTRPWHVLRCGQEDDSEQDRMRGWGQYFCFGREWINSITSRRGCLPTVPPSDTKSTRVQSSLQCVRDWPYNLLLGRMILLVDHFYTYTKAKQ